MQWRGQNTKKKTTQTYVLVDVSLIHDKIGWEVWTPIIIIIIIIIIISFDIHKYD